MWDLVFGIGDARCVCEGRPDVVFQGWSVRGGTGEVDALLFFNLDGFLWSILCKGREKVRDCINH